MINHWRLYVDDGASSAYAEITCLQDLSLPVANLDQVERKCLDAATAAKDFRDGLIDPGELVFTALVRGSVGMARYQALFGVQHNYKVVADDGGLAVYSGKLTKGPEVSATDRNDETAAKMTVKVAALVAFSGGSTSMTMSDEAWATMVAEHGNEENVRKAMLRN